MKFGFLDDAGDYDQEQEDDYDGGELQHVHARTCNIRPS